MYLPTTPELWIFVHLLSITLAIFSRVALAPLFHGLVLSLLLAGVGIICLMAAASFWTQQAHAVLSCMTLGIVLIAVVLDRPDSATSDVLLRIAMADDAC